MRRRSILWLGLFLGGALVILCLVALPSCGGTTTSPTTCTRTFFNLDSQALCNTEAQSHGCAVPATWSPTTGDCIAILCTQGCP